MREADKTDESRMLEKVENNNKLVGCAYMGGRGHTHPVYVDASILFNKINELEKRIKKLEG